MAFFVNMTLFMDDIPLIVGKTNLSDIPKPINVQSREFAQLLEEWNAYHAEVFPEQPTGNRFAASRTLPGAKEFREQLKKADDFHKAYAVALATRLAIYRQTGIGYNGKEAWPHQIALAIDEIHAVARGARGMLTVETAGSGKTLMSGFDMQAAVDMQLRGETNKSVLFLTSHARFEMQQTMSEDSRRLLAIPTSPDKIPMAEIAEQAQYLSQAVRARGGSADLISAELWARVMHEGAATPEHASEIVKRIFGEAGIYKTLSKLKNANLLLQECANLASRNACIILSPDGKSLETMGVTRPEEHNTEDHTIWDGDLAYGIHPLLQQVPGAVYSESALLDIERIGKYDLKRRPNVIFLAASKVTQSNARRRLAQLLQGVGLIIVDEMKGRKQPQNYFHDMIDGEEVGGETPFVKANMAADSLDRRTHGLINYDHKQPTLSLADAINAKKPVCQPIAYDIFPDAEGMHWQPGTFESAEQLVRYYGSKLPFPEDRNRTQISEGPHIIAVPQQLVPYVTMRLRQEYGNKGITFISADANQAEPYTNRVMARMIDPKLQNVALVGSVRTVYDAHDFRNLRGVIKATPETDAEGLNNLRLVGRAQHSKHTCLVAEQHFSGRGFDKTIVSTIPPHVETRERDGTNSIVPGQILYGTKAGDADQRVIAEKKDAGEPYARRNLILRAKKQQRSPVPTSHGSSPISLTEQRRAFDEKGTYLPDGQRSVEEIARETQDAMRRKERDVQQELREAAQTFSKKKRPAVSEFVQRDEQVIEQLQTALEQGRAEAGAIAAKVRKRLEQLKKERTERRLPKISKSPKSQENGGGRESNGMDLGRLSQLRREREERPSWLDDEEDDFPDSDFDDMDDELDAMMNDEDLLSDV